MSNMSSWDFGTSYDEQEVSLVFCFVSFNNGESATYSICNSFKQAWDVSQICKLCRRHLENRLQLDSEVQVGCVWLVLLAGCRVLNERHTLLCESPVCKTQSVQWRTTGTNRQQLRAPGLVSVEPHVFVRAMWHAWNSALQPVFVMWWKYSASFLFWVHLGNQQGDGRSLDSLLSLVN